MNDKELTTRKVLKVLGEVNCLLRDHAVAIGRRSGVKSTLAGLEVIDYQNGPMVEAYVDAEMDNGTGLTWRLDVTWTDESFNVRGTLERNSRAGAETLEQLPDRKVRDVDEFPQVLTSTTRALLALDSR